MQVSAFFHGLRQTGTQREESSLSMNPDEVRAVQTIVKKTVENEKHIRIILEQQTLLHQKLDRILQALASPEEED